MILLIYADYAATTPVSERVYDTLCQTTREIFGNPSSAHSFGRAAAEAVELARERAAFLIGCDPDEIFFTSGGTESDNHAVRFAKGKRIVTSEIEHPAVLESARHTASAVELIKVGRDGAASVDSLRQILRDNPDTALVSLMYANNETGVIQPVREAADSAHAAGALFHCDAVQGAGHGMPSVRELDCDLMSVSGHKLYAPKGIGLIYIRKEIIKNAPALHYGGGQERTLRSGTIPTPLIAAFGEACAEAREVMLSEENRIRGLRDKIERELLKLPDSMRIGSGKRVAGISCLSFAGTTGEALMLLCDLRGVALSAGSACHSGDDTPSHVLSAMDIPEEYRSSAIRISIGRNTTEDDAVKIIETVSECVALARGE